MPLDFPSQIVKPPQVLSHLLCSGRYSAFSHFTSFSCCDPVVPLRCVSPRRRLQVLTVQTVLSSEAVGASSSKRLPGETQRRNTTGAIACPRSNHPISTNPISSAFSGRYFFPCRTHAPLDFPAQIPTSPISSAFTRGRVSWRRFII